MFARYGGRSFSCSSSTINVFLLFSFRRWVTLCGRPARKAYCALMSFRSSHPVPLVRRTIKVRGSLSLPPLATTHSDFSQSRATSWPLNHSLLRDICSQVRVLPSYKTFHNVGYNIDPCGRPRLYLVISAQLSSCF